MNKLGISAIQHERVSIDVADSISGILISVVGDIDMQDPSKLLDPFFQNLHQAAITTGIDTIELDFRRLNFLNSSGIKALAKWVMLLGQENPAKRYTIRILHNKTVAWQSTSLPTLTYLVPGAISLE